MPWPVLDDTDLLGILKRIEPDVNFESAPPRFTSSTGNVYYGKMGTVNEKEQYTGEAASLQEIAAASPGLAPRVISLGNLDDGRPYMITEFKEGGSLTDKGAALLGKRLATELHAYKSAKGFGFDVATFCGATRQPEGWYQSWEECFSALLVNLLNQLKGRRGYSELCGKGEEIRTK